ncbi:MAG TPA: hypothetical protein DCR04_02040 [Flavobacteriales bacterium]|nr:hypothetical protein [Flavobacteriales bacterium]
MNSLGQQVESFKATNTDKVEIELPESRGIYFLNFATEDGTVSNLRIVKN